MAKVAIAKSDETEKKARKAAPGASVKIKAKKDGKSGAKAAKAAKPAKKSVKHDGFDGLAKLVDHPLVADLLAAGAIAAVAAIAQHQMGKGMSSSKMVKSVGKAAATAMGMRLMGDLSAIGGAAANAAKKA